MRPPAVVVAVAVVVLGLLARAGSAAADDRPASTVQRLSTTLHDQLVELLASQSRAAMDLAVCVVPASQDAGARRLAERLQSLLTAASTHDGWRSVVPFTATGACEATAEAAREGGQARSIEVVVHVGAAVRDGRLFLEGTVLRADRSLWREIAGGRAASVLGQVFASARLDAELRFYFPVAAPPLTKRTIGIWHETPGAVLALAAGDVDGDDVDELIVLRRDGLDLLGAQAPGPRARLLATLPLGSLPLASVASRDPVGTVALLPRVGRTRRIALRTSDQAYGIVVGWDGARFGTPTPLTLSDGATGSTLYPVDSGDRGLLCAILPPGRNTFEARTLPCSDAPASRPATGAGPFWNVSFASIVQPSGEVVWSIALATAEPRLITTNAGVTTDLGPSGAAILSTDLDDDGVVELVRSSAALPGEPDRITVTSLAADGPHDTWTSRPTLGAVTAFAASDLDADGTLELVWAELHRGGSRIWLSTAEPR